jgi:negative regulator of flagellin synthesis FlgM
LAKKPKKVSSQYLSRTGKRVKIKVDDADIYKSYERKGSIMTIDRLGPVDPISKYKSTAKASRTSYVQGKDSIDVSDEAKAKAELMRAAEIVRSSPDIREDRVAEVKKRLEDPNYINDKVKGLVADRVMDMLGL